MGAARANDLHGSSRDRLRPAHRLWQRAAEGEHCHQLQGRSEVRPPPPPASCHPPPICASRRSHAATRFGSTPLKKRRASISTGSTSASGAAPCKTGRRSSRRTLGCMWLWCMAVMGPPPSSSMAASAPGGRSRSPRTCRAVRTWTTLAPPHPKHRSVPRPVTTSAHCVSCVPKRPTAWQQTTTWDGRTGGVTRSSRVRCATCW